MKFFLMADRYELMRKKVWPALEKGNIVISIRSFISTLVYQCNDTIDMAATAFTHRFAPLPNLLILFDLDSDISFARIQDRENEKAVKKKGSYEKKDLLKIHRERYQDICIHLFSDRLKIIDASGSIEEIAEQTWKAVEGTAIEQK